MRVLLTTTGNRAHVRALVPFAEAFRRTGNELLFAAPASAARLIAAAGFPVTLLDEAPPDERRAVLAVAAELAEPDADRLVAAELFAQIDARAAYADVLEAIETFRPDLVLHETAEFAGQLAAERAGVASARVGTGPAPELDPVPVLDALDELRKDLGLDRDPLGERLASMPYLTLAPASLDDAPAIHALRFRDARTEPRPLPDLWPGDHRPLLYLTLRDDRSAIEALGNLSMRVLVRLAGDRYPAQLGVLPANVRAARGIADADALPRASIVVCDGDLDTVRRALAASVPVVMLPRTSQERRTARRVVELGAGIVLDGGPAAIAWLRESVRRLRADPAYRGVAADVAEETWDLPPVDTAPTALRELLTLV